MTAALFFDRQPKDLQGEALVVCNCVVVLILLITALRSIGVMGVEIRELQLTFVDDKSVVQLPMLNDEFATHLYISQYWKMNLSISARTAAAVRTGGSRGEASEEVILQDAKARRPRACPVLCFI